jgi:hypothetical protein
MEIGLINVLLYWLFTADCQITTFKIYQVVGSSFSFENAVMATHVALFKIFFVISVRQDMYMTMLKEGKLGENIWVLI